MNQSIEQRMLNIEQELSEIRKELEESLARYKERRIVRIGGPGMSLIVENIQTDAGLQK